MIYIIMISLSFLIFSVMAGLKASSSTSLSSLRILTKDCNQTGLDNYRVSNCSDMEKIPRMKASTGPEWDSVQIKISKDGLTPVVNVAWKLRGDGSLRAIRGSEINIRDENTNQSVCEQIHFSVKNMENSKEERWTFSLDVVVEPTHTYTITVFHFPEPDIGHYRIVNQTPVPGCKDPRIKNSQLCQENGSLWIPRIAAAFTEKKDSIIVEFDSAEYSESYLVSIQSGSVNCSKLVNKENRTRLNVTLECVSSRLSQYEVMIQPYFIGCKNNCESAKKNITRSQSSRSIKICLGMMLIFVGVLVYLLQKASHKAAPVTPASADKQQPEVFQVQERKRVLIIYSLDHLLYKNIVLKFSAFLAAKCGTDVVVDLLDSTRLGILGSIQWLEWHKEQIERSSDKILILCSRGVQAKWRAMCGGKQVFLREDALSPIGDTLTPSLTLLTPYFIRSASFEKYIVAYFDDVCSEEDIPLPFKITVRYKLMKQFEEVFFRILNTEKHEPGRVKQINGLSEDKYHECPSGGALKDAVEAFRKYQLEHPYWFQEELLERSELEDLEATEECDEQKIRITDHLTCVFNSVQLISDMEIQNSVVTINETKIQLAEMHEMGSTLEFNSHTVQGIQLL
ncbi:interleukin-17 receptor A-like [Xiphophorus maculatus]|uniref:interleukin-17 receptor A-like n=1 Tax=Xiphophorus maculatus TaxID=8083 RepID=UPI000C6DD20A|nr:interleukin-17 receptor A-like [Xiphophorus maculatus]